MEKNVLKFMIFISFAFIAFFCNAKNIKANSCNGYMYTDQTCWLGLGYKCEDKVLDGPSVGTYANMMNTSEGCYIKTIYNEKFIEYKGKEYRIDFNVINGQGNKEIYRVKVFTPKKSLEDMDSSYDYGNVTVNDCRDFYSSAVSVSFDGLTACGITGSELDNVSVYADGTAIFNNEKESFKGGCTSSAFNERIFFVFRGKDSSGTENTYYGFICRKLKDGSTPTEVIDMEATVGEEKYIGDEQILTAFEFYEERCEITDGGDLAILGTNEYRSNTNCNLTAIKEGTISVKRCYYLNNIQKGNCNYLKVEAYGSGVEPIPVIDSCASLLGDPDEEYSPAFYISFAFKIIKYVAIIMLVVLTVIDLIGAIASHDDDELKKAIGRAGKRLIYCVIIFLLPILLDYILKVINKSSIKNCIKY